MSPECRQRGVVFVHGLFSSGTTWDPFRDLIAQDPELQSFETLTFSYASRPAALHPLRRIPPFDDVADSLRGFLDIDARHLDDLVLVSHSQGGLVLQRYLSRMLNEARGLELARIRRVVLFACPNLGSELALSLRRTVWRGRHPHENQLRPISSAVTEAQRIVVTRIDNATAGAPDQHPIAITAYAGDSDNIVTSTSARNVFRDVGVLPGDHFTIIKPDSPKHRSYTALKHLLLTDPPTWTRSGGGHDVTTLSTGGVPTPPTDRPPHFSRATAGSPSQSHAQRTTPAADPATDIPRKVTEWSARLLGVKPAIEAKGTEGDLPLYVSRDHDLRLRGVIADTATTGGLVVLVGEPSTGKSRSAYEAVRAQLPDWRLVRPHTAADLDALVPIRPSRTVVWLDDLNRFLDAQPGLTTATLLRLIDPRTPVVLVGALWPDAYDAYASSASRPGDAEAPGGSEPREVLQLAKTVHVAGELSASELEAAQAAANKDPRIAAALAGSDFGLFQTLAGAPDLVRRWRSGDPYGRALMNAAIDAVRVGEPETLSPDYLREAAIGYLTSAQRAKAEPSWLDSALDYCTTMVNGATAALSPVSGDLPGSIVGYELADYLLRVGEQHRRFTPVPAEAWAAMLGTVTEPQVLTRIGWSAEWRMLYKLAHEFYRAAGQDGVTRRAQLLMRQGLNAQATSLLRDHAQGGSTEAVNTLVSWEWSGNADPERVITRLAEYAPNNPYAAEKVARSLDKLGRTRESLDYWVRLAEHGHPRAVQFAVNHLLSSGHRSEAVELLRSHARTGEDRRTLVDLLLEDGTEAGTAEAERWLRRWLEQGDVLGLLPTLLLRQGRVQEVEELADEDLDWARDHLLEYWEDRGARDPESAEHAVEVCHRWGHDERGQWLMINLLQRLGRTPEAIEAALAFERERGGNDDLDSVITSMLLDQGRRDEVRARADAGDSRAQGIVAEQLLEKGDISGLEQRAARGEWHACRLLSEWLEERGRVSEAVSLWRRWVDMDPDGSRFPLFEILDRHGLNEDLLELLEAEPEPLGKRNGRRLASLLVKLGRISELRDRAADGDQYADTQLIAYLLDNGQYEEACQRAAAGSGAASRMLLSAPHSGREAVPGLSRYGLRVDGSVATPDSAED